ncbi:MAG TPA: hypothetical protein VEW46_16135 [Pyrinomonadaceae bacterium]|nr:hypothetical protein [Pyrinomonadaceae bacterium]
MPGDFFDAIGFRATAFFDTGFLGAVRLIGVAFFTVPLDETVLFSLDFAFAAFRGVDFRGIALVAFGRLVVAFDVRRLAADFGEAR